MFDLRTTLIKNCPRCFCSCLRCLIYKVHAGFFRCTRLSACLCYHIVFDLSRTFFKVFYQISTLFFAFRTRPERFDIITPRNPFVNKKIHEKINKGCGFLRVCFDISHSLVQPVSDRHKIQKHGTAFAVPCNIFFINQRPRSGRIRRHCACRPRRKHRLLLHRGRQRSCVPAGSSAGWLLPAS